MRGNAEEKWHQKSPKKTSLGNSSIKCVDYSSFNCLLSYSPKTIDHCQESSHKVRVRLICHRQNWSQLVLVSSSQENDDKLIGASTR